MLVRTSVDSGVLVVPALTQAVCSGCMDNVQENTVHTVVSSASPTAPVPAASSSSASLSLISKRAQKGKKNPPGSRNQQKKAHKAAVASALASSSARVACLSSELDDALSARDSARSDASRASAKAREWKNKYQIVEDAATRDRLVSVSSRLLAVQREQNLSPPPVVRPKSPELRSLLPAPYPGRTSRLAPPSSSQLP